MENVKLHQFKNDVLIEEIHSNKNDSSNESNNLSVLKYDKSALIKPSEVKQYMFKVKYPDIELEKKPLMVGKLDISWRYSMGECGHLQTHPLEQPVLLKLTHSLIEYNTIIILFYFQSPRLIIFIIGN